MYFLKVLVKTFDYKLISTGFETGSIKFRKKTLIEHSRKLFLSIVLSSFTELDWTQSIVRLSSLGFDKVRLPNCSSGYAQNTVSNAWKNVANKVILEGQKKDAKTEQVPSDFQSLIKN